MSTKYSTRDGVITLKLNAHLTPDATLHCRVAQVILAYFPFCIFSVENVLQAFAFKGQVEGDSKTFRNRLTFALTSLTPKNPKYTNAGLITRESHGLYYTTSYLTLIGVRTNKQVKDAFHEALQGIVEKQQRSTVKSVQDEFERAHDELYWEVCLFRRTLNVCYTPSGTVYAR